MTHNYAGDVLVVGCCRGAFQEPLVRSRSPSRPKRLAHLVQYYIGNPCSLDRAKDQPFCLGLDFQAIACLIFTVFLKPR